MSKGQCETCGRCDVDWTDKQSRVGGDSKGRQIRTARDKTSAYRDWRWQRIGRDCYVNDIDMIEWRMRNGVPTPVAVLELTELQGDMKPPDTYLQAIIDRYEKRDGQATAIRRFAEMLGTEARIVLFKWDLSEFWTYNLSRHGPSWRHRTREQYESDLRSL